MPVESKRCTCGEGACSRWVAKRLSSSFTENGSDAPPGLTARLPRHRCIFGEQLGNVAQVGNMVQGFMQGNAAVDAE